MSEPIGARVVRLSVDSEDHHRLWSWTSVAFVVGAVGLAIMGLPPIDLHSPLHDAGVMDPLCGGTRATLALARGEVATAFRYNPGVPFLALGVLAGCVRLLVGGVWGRWVTVRAGRLLLVGLLVALVVLEVNQQLHADLLMARDFRAG